MIQDTLDRLRKEIFLTAYASGAKAAHLAPAFSALEILYTLYMRGILRYDPSNPAWEERDRLILSKGHASLALYCVMAEAGMISRAELATFCKPGTRLGGEPNKMILPGIETSSGSLGHGLSYGVGLALAAKMDRKNTRIYVIIGDGECQEGSVWEAAMSAPHHKLDNLTVILDWNGIQKMGRVADIMGIDSWGEKWYAFGWDVCCTDGHNVIQLENALHTLGTGGKPRLVIASTTKGKGVSIMENNPDWHFKMPNKKELKVVVAELGITEEELAKCRELI